ncbi:MAG: Do family serine endopeptidase [Bacteroidales bacterium]|nr:Do family serine endopeptidase [Bacteroidales bacterium]MBN2763562.1 Do family serine endopeptidase [Bacteroidales bacterium]
MKKYSHLIIASIVGSAITLSVFMAAGFNRKADRPFFHSDNVIPARNVVYSVKEDGEIVPLEFTDVSKQVMDAVVHVRTSKKVAVRNQGYYFPQFPSDPFSDDFFRFFFDQPAIPKNYKENDQPLIQSGSGSGVIINSNGYIITNNHVIEGADEIEVSLPDNEIYKAKVIGSDPSTDLALLQIKKDGLKSIPVGNSDEVEVGEWVLAVGNPFNLNSTVTAGIVSAKGRNINIINDKSAIEAFIQTDAAINPGNSGGALVNLKGELIGINTAIASPTGTYAGYGFAIPANIVNKVITDIMKYGMVQRAYLGVIIRDIDGNFAEKNNLKAYVGAYVDSLVEKGAASNAGIKKGDVITGIEGKQVKRTADVLEQIGRHHPGDEISVKVDRNGKELTFDVILANLKGEKKVTERSEQGVLDILGASFETLDEKTARKLGIEGGVRVKDLRNGILKNQTTMKEGFIITGVNNKKVTTVEQMKKELEDVKGGAMISGVYENYPGEMYYAFGLE